jgi:hypothetical protein
MGTRYLVGKTGCELAKEVLEEDEMYLDKSNFLSNVGVTLILSLPDAWRSGWLYFTAPS